MSEASWVRVQQKTFTRWVNTYLVERMHKVEDLATDFKDGLLLLELLEIISSKTIKYNQKPRIRQQMLENLSFALDFLKGEGIKLVNIAPGDIEGGNLKLILGLIWTIILRYQIQVSQASSAKQELLDWVRSKIPEYNINNFTNDWTSGKAICALAEAVLPGQMRLPQDFTNNPVNDARMGMQKAKQNMNIPDILDAEDMVHSPDELASMTYISYFRDYLDMESRRREQELFERTPVAAKCIAHGRGLEPGNEACIETEFTIEARNGAGRRVPVGGHTFPVAISSPDGNVPSTTVDNGDGTYRVTYTPRVEGNHSISVTFGGANISGSPFNVFINAAKPDPMQCKVYGPGIEAAEAHQPTNFTIEARNKLGGIIVPKQNPFVTRLTDPYGEPVPTDTRDNGNGTYTVSYCAVDPGNHRIEVLLGGKTHVAQSPYNVNVSESSTLASPSRSYIDGPGLQPGNRATDPCVFTIHAVTPDGRPATSGKDIFDVHIEDPSFALINPQIVNNHDGTYTVTYQPTDAGTYHIDVVARNPAKPLFYDHLKNSPATVNIEAGTDPSQSIAFGPGLEPGNLDTFPAYFTIQARDNKGNNRTDGGDPFEVNVQGPSGPVPVKVQDNGDGTYKVEYDPETAGNHDIAVTLRGQPIKGSTFHVDIKPGAWPANTFIKGFSFVIETRDKRNTVKREGGEKIAVAINGPSGQVPVELKDNHDGTYTANYSLGSPPTKGTYNISVHLNETDIRGSPFIQTVN